MHNYSGERVLSNNNNKTPQVTTLVLGQAIGPYRYKLHVPGEHSEPPAKGTRTAKAHRILAVEGLVCTDQDAGHVGPASVSL